MNKIGKSYIFIKYSLSNLSKIIRYIWIEKKYPRHANIKHEFLALKRINLKFSYSSNMYTFTNSCSKQPSKVSRLLVALLLTVTTNNNYHERGLIFVTVNIAPRVYPIGFPILDKFPPYPHANPPPPPHSHVYTPDSTSWNYVPLTRDIRKFDPQLHFSICFESSRLDIRYTSLLFRVRTISPPYDLWRGDKKTSRKLRSSFVYIQVSENASHEVTRRGMGQGKVVVNPGRERRNR